MSTTENRKSMDDVLASIRRIVRAEKEPDSAAITSGGYGTTSRTSHARPRGDEQPLALTPDMRTDAGVEDAEIVDRPEEARIATAAEEVVVPPAPAAPAMPDRDALKAMVREILLEELTGPEVTGAVRGMIRDELTNGEIGGNISQNVLRLIQTEIEKALKDR